jgi:hypothetical protein
MLTAAGNFLENLTRGQQRRVLSPPRDPERFNRDYMPGPRRCVQLLTGAGQHSLAGRFIMLVTIEYCNR